MKTIAILMATLLVFSVMPMVLAQETVVEPIETEVVDAGITPDSPLYGLERAMERLKLVFMRDKAERALYKIKMAEERLAETEVMLEEGNLEAAQEAEEAHDEIIAEAEQEAEEIETDEDESIAEDALGDVERVQLSLLSHSEKVALIKNRILDKMAAGNASEEKLAHITAVFEKIKAKALEMEQKVAEKREKVRTRYKVLSEKNETELTEREAAFLQRKERIKEKIKVSEDESEDEVEDGSEDEVEDESEEETDNQSQAGQ